MRHPSTLTPHHRERLISQHSCIFRCICQPVLVTSAFSIFIENIFSPILYFAHQRIISLPFHNILRPLLTTTHWELTTSLTTFRPYFSISRDDWFEIFCDCTGYLDYFFPWKQRHKIRKIENVMSSVYPAGRKKLPKNEIGGISSLYKRVEEGDKLSPLYNDHFFRA